MKRYTKPIHLQELIPQRRADASLALINVVFLLLLFLLVAGTLRPPLPDDFQWAETVSDEGSGSIQGSLALDKSGEIWLDGNKMRGDELATFLKSISDVSDKLTLQVDRRTKMGDLTALAEDLKAAGIRKITLVTIEADGT